MKKLLFLLVALATLTSCRVNFNRNSGPEITSVRHARPFDRIEVVSACDVKFIQGDTFSVKIVGPKGRVEQMETKFSGSKLTISSSHDINLFNFGGDKTPTVYITSPDLVEARLTMAGDFDIEGPFDTDTLNIYFEGTGDVNLNQVVCDEFRVSLIGTGDMDVKQLTAQYSKVLLQGTGDIEINFNNCGEADCTLQGTGDITLSGSIRQLRKSIDGTGDINEKQLHITGN